MTISTTGPATASVPGRVAGTRTRLAALALSGPLFATVSLTQAVTRDGFDLRRHPLSMLSDGSLGWLQVANFLATGVLLVVGATGLRAALRGTPGGVWAPRLLGVTGTGLLLAGVFRMDPADGFPVGTPAGVPDHFTWHAYVHNAVSSVAFIALIAACFVVGRHFSRAGRRRLAVVSRVAGAVCVAGNAWALSGAPAGALTVAIGVLGAMLWMSTVGALLRAASR